MKIVILILSLFLASQTFAQKDCEFSVNLNDSIGSYKETKDFVIHENIFGKNSTYVLLSLINNNNTPMLKLQKIVKSADFIQANCFNAGSKLYFQLRNGKIVTLLYASEDTCGNFLNLEDQKLGTRIISGTFLFVKGSIEDLKASPITFLRVRYTSETTDYVIEKQLTSKLMNQTFYPENYFMDNLQCIIDN